MVLGGPGIQHIDKIFEALGQYKGGNKKTLIKLLTDSTPGISAISPKTKPAVKEFFTEVIPGEIE